MRMLLAGLLMDLLQIYSLLLIIRAVLSFFPPSTGARWYYQVTDFLERITEPVLEPIRRILPPVGGMDFSVVVALIVIQLLYGLLARSY